MPGDFTADIQDVLNRSFDFVVIGGGTAGLCLASRLSEDPNISILVLEAGSNRLDDPKLLYPAQYGHHFGQPDYDWAMRTTAQEFSNGREYIWSRGKVLGGSSAINFLCWLKPPADEVDDWERLGNKGWNWDTFQGNLRKVEGYKPLDDSNVTHHLNSTELQSQLGKDGPLKLHHPNTITLPEVKAFEALLELGVPRAPKPYDGNPKGAFFCATTIDPSSYTRSYAATAFYLPNAGHENFKVLTSASVNKIVTEAVHGKELVATGVEFVYGGQTYVAKAKMEVILCAGALKSPQILELSGIGKKAVLEAVGVECHLDLSGVGENLQEHMCTSTTYELSADILDLSLDILRDPKGYQENFEKLKESPRSGAFTVGVSGVAFVPLQEISERGEEMVRVARQKYEQRKIYPPGLKEQHEILLQRMERKENRAAPCEIMIYPGFFSSPNPPEKGKKYITILAATNHPFSRGTIHVTSSDPAVAPAIDPHYFEEDIDLQVFVELLKFARKVAQTSPLKQVLASPLKEVNPGPDVVTDEQLANYLKSFSTTISHTTGTLSMLPKEKGGVVDNDLKVYGTSNIRVADLSVVPLHVAAPTMAIAYAIGMQAAEIIKKNIQLK